MQKGFWIRVFILAFGLNLLWELWHRQFYESFLNGPVVFRVILCASFLDGIAVIAIFWLFFKIPEAHRKTVFLVIAGILLQVSVEIIAIRFRIWSYNPSMPIIPVINTGLTPSIQIGLTAYLTYLLTRQERDGKKSVHPNP